MSNLPSIFLVMYHTKNGSIRCSIVVDDDAVDDAVDDADNDVDDNDSDAPNTITPNHIVLIPIPFR